MVTEIPTGKYPEIRKYSEKWHFCREKRASASKGHELHTKNKLILNLHKDTGID